MKNEKLISIGILFFTSFLLSCGEQNTLKEIQIGTQIWSVENLNVCHFKNGDLIPEGKTKEELKIFGDSGRPAWCYYDFDPTNGKKYGKLYNWYAVNDPRGLAPNGWHIPSDSEWTVLTDYLGGIEKAGTKLKATNGWEYNSNGTNESCFTALPGGCQSSPGTGNLPSFWHIGTCGNWWSSTITNVAFNDCAYKRFLDLMGIVGRSSEFMDNCLSVRCIKN